MNVQPLNVILAANGSWLRRIQVPDTVLGLIYITFQRLISYFASQLGLPNF